METYHSRSQSFQKTKAPKSASKSARSATLSWPHPDTFKATPSTLAEAGFYFNPSKEDPDNVRCFMCEKELGGWESDDDPFDIHTRKCPKCPWVVARCSLANDFDSDGNFSTTDVKRLPTGKFMEKARLDTFRVNEKLWPHDSSKNHGATSKKMASAGFAYTPQVSGDDTATCYYCDLALSGWDQGDDPMEEHRKRESRSGKPCPFFHAQLQSRTKSSSTKPPPADTMTRKGKTKQVDDEILSASESDGSVKDTGGGKAKGRKGSSKPPPSRSKPKPSVQKTRSTKTDEENTEQSEFDVAPVKSLGATKKSKKKTISQAKLMSPVQEVTRETTEDEAPEPSETKGKSRGATKVKQKPSSTRPASSRNRTTTSTLPEKHTDTMPEQSEPDDVQQSVKPTKNSTKKPPSSKSLSRAKSTSALRKAKPEKIEEESDQSESEVAAVLALPSGPATSSQPVTTSAETTIDDVQHSEPRDDPPAVDQKKHREKSFSSRPPSRAKSGRSTKSAKTDDEVMGQSESEVAPADVDAAKKPRKKVSKPPPRAKPVSSVRRSAKDSDAEDTDVLDHEDVNVPAPNPKPQGTSKKNQQEAHEAAMHVDEPPTPPLRPPNPEPAELSEPATPLEPSIDENIATPVEYVDIEPPQIESPALFAPPLASFPMKQISSLSAEERTMTVEQWIRHEMDLQYEQLKRDGERRIEAFKQRAAEVRLRIEAL